MKIVKKPLKRWQILRTQLRTHLAQAELYAPSGAFSSMRLILGRTESINTERDSLQGLSNQIEQEKAAIVKIFRSGYVEA
jgi:hypothetical protein